MTGRGVNYGVHDVGSIESMIPADSGWMVVDPDGGAAYVIAWAVIVVERSGWVVSTRVAPVAICPWSGELKPLSGEGVKVIRTKETERNG